MNSYTFISPDEILTDVLKQVDDERMEFSTKGFYIRAVQQAIQDAAFQTFFDDRPEVFTFPEKGYMPMPEGCIDLRNVYLFNGDKCDISNAQTVHWKRNFISYGNGYVANNRGNNFGDPYYSRHSEIPIITNSGIQNLFYYNIQDGQLMFSSACKKFQKVFLIYKGIGTPIGAVPIIPLFLQRMVTDHVTEYTLRLRMAKEPNRWTTLWKVYDQRLNGEFDGSLAKARRFVASLNNGQRNDLKMYLSRGQWA